MPPVSEIAWLSVLWSGRGVRRGGPAGQDRQYPGRGGVGLDGVHDEVLVEGVGCGDDLDVEVEGPASGWAMRLGTEA